MPGFWPQLLAGGSIATATARHVAGRAARSSPRNEDGGQLPAVDLSVGPENGRSDYASAEATDGRRPNY